jgi:hypothetical protein
MADDLRRLLDTGLMEEVERDEDGAFARLGDAERHLESAERIASEDPNGALQLAYDAARKAITAHMLARGLRVTNRPGAYTTGRYAVAELGETFRPFDRMRRRRNRSEYGTSLVSDTEVTEAITSARAMVVAAHGDLSPA